MRILFLSVKYGSNNAFLVSAVRYSSHPEESTSTRSETVIALTVGILPLDSFRDSSKVAHASRGMNSYCSVEYVHLQFLPGGELQAFSKFLGNYDLKLRRDFDHFHDITSVSLSTKSAETLNENKYDIIGTYAKNRRTRNSSVFCSASFWPKSSIHQRAG